ncbi:MAG: penicillin-binding protein activator [Sulfuricellaceae bacterium]|jgi:outer membrane PBP1 activator LpoA protein
MVFLLGGGHAYAADPDVQPDSPTGQTSPQILTPKSEEGLPAEAASASAHKACLILPLQSESYGALAEPVQAGFMAARKVDEAQSQFSANVYATGDKPEESVTAYQQAIKEGCQVVIGPLTRNAVTAVAKSGLVTVPTIALNTPDVEDKQRPARLYSFGIQVEAEAHLVALYAHARGARRVLTVTASTPLAKRMQQAFADEWSVLGDGVVDNYILPPGKAVYQGLQEEVAAVKPDMVFLATDARRARMARPYIGGAVPAYGTSQVYGARDGSQRNVDLNGVLFVDMPWLVQPDHPAVMIYPRPPESYSLDMERLYALGIDAYRLLNWLVNPSFREGNVVLDGVTGRIRLGEHGQFLRDLPLAEFRQGEVQLVSQAKEQ